MVAARTTPVAGVVAAAQAQRNAVAAPGTLAIAAVSAAYSAALLMTGSRSDAERLVSEAAEQAEWDGSGDRAEREATVSLLRALVRTYFARFGADSDRTDRSTAQAAGTPQAPRVPARATAEQAGREALWDLEPSQITAVAQRLPITWRAVTALYFAGDFSYQELAWLLNEPVETVRSWLHRGRRLLRTELLCAVAGQAEPS